MSVENFEALAGLLEPLVQVVCPPTPTIQSPQGGGPTPDAPFVSAPPVEAGAPAGPFPQLPETGAGKPGGADADLIPILASVAASGLALALGYFIKRRAGAE